MGEGSKIAWTDHSYNPWRGCSKIGPGCDGCYAAARDKRYEGGLHWGAGAPRIRAVEHTRNLPYRLQKKILAGTITGRKVFAASLADIFDNEIDPIWRDDFWNVVRDTPELDYLIVTKRVGNVPKMLPKDWGQASYAHVGIIATMVNQEEWDRDAGKLIRLKFDHAVSWVGASIEPQIGPIKMGRRALDVDWIIGGGESKQPDHVAREYDLDWARSLIAECREAGTAYFQKQTGQKPLGCDWPKDGAGDDPALWPEDIRVRQFPKQLQR